MQMLSRIKLVVIVIAWSSAVLTSYSTSVLASPCNLSGSLSGEVFRPPHFTTPISTWSLQTDGNKPTHETDGSVQGVLKGVFSAPELNIESPVFGAWSYNKTDGKLLIILSGNTFGIDIALSNLPSPSYTFSGNLYVEGNQPAYLVLRAGSMICA